jgi:predicted RNA-binding protein with PIN domain
VHRDHLYIDAFNLTHRIQETPLKNRFPNIQDLVYGLESFAASHDKQITLVLDGSRFKDQYPSSKLLEIICSHPGESADAVIERRIEEIPAPMRLYAVVVSDDRALIQMARGSGVRVQNCGQLVEQLKEKTNEKNSSSDPSQEPFSTPFEGI